MGRWIFKRTNYGGTPPEFDQDGLDYIVMDFRNYIEKHYYDSRIGMSRKQIASIYDESKLPATFYTDTVIDLMYKELNTTKIKSEKMISIYNTVSIIAVLIAFSSILLTPTIFSFLGFMDEEITRTLLVYYFSIGVFVCVITYIIRDSLMKNQNIDRRFTDLVTAAFITTGILAEILITLTLIESTYTGIFFILSISIGSIMFYYPLLKFKDSLFPMKKVIKNNCTECFHLKENICRKFGYYWIEEVALRTTCKKFEQKENIK